MPAEAARRIVIAGQEVGYALRRSRRRTIGLSVDQRGLRVGAPVQATVREIEALLQHHGDWVIDKLKAWRDRPAPKQLDASHGATLSLLGKPIRLNIQSAPRAGWTFDDAELHLRLPEGADAGRTLEAALRDHARHILARQLALHAARLGVPTPPLRLSSARTRWGSCNHRGGISLNWRLVFMPPEVVDYVVCHELAHLKEMNHSPRFWSVVETLCPAWRALRQELARLSREIPQP